MKTEGTVVRAGLEAEILGICVPYADSFTGRKV